MAGTVTRAAPEGIGGAQQAGRGATQSAVRGRLDDVAESGDTGLREALTGRPAPVRSDRKPADHAGTLRARVGAAFSLVIASAVKLLQFLQRLAVQLLEALRRLARRPRAARAEPEAAGADEKGPAQNAADERANPASVGEAARSATVAGPCRAAMRRARNLSVLSGSYPRCSAAEPRHLPTEVGGDEY